MILLNFTKFLVSSMGLMLFTSIVLIRYADDDKWKEVGFWAGKVAEFLYGWVCLILLYYFIRYHW